MPVQRFVLLLVSVIAAGALSVWGFGLLAAGLGGAPTLGWMAMAPGALIAWLVWRGLKGRIR